MPGQSMVNATRTKPTASAVRAIGRFQGVGGSACVLRRAPASENWIQFLMVGGVDEVKLM